MPPMVSVAAARFEQVTLALVDTGAGRSAGVGNRAGLAVGIGEHGDAVGRAAAGDRTLEGEGIAGGVCAHRQVIAAIIL